MVTTILMLDIDTERERVQPWVEAEVSSKGLLSCFNGKCNVTMRMRYSNITCRFIHKPHHILDNCYLDQCNRACEVFLALSSFRFIFSAGSIKHENYRSFPKAVLAFAFTRRRLPLPILAEYLEAYGLIFQRLSLTNRHSICGHLHR